MLFYSRSYFIFILFHEVSVHLKHLIRFIDSFDFLCEAFCLSHQIALAASRNSIHILYLRCPDIAKIPFTRTTH